MKEKNMHEDRNSRRYGYEDEDLGYNKRSNRDEAVFIFYCIIITNISLTPMRINFQTRSQLSQSQEQMVQTAATSKIMKIFQSHQRSAQGSTLPMISTTSLTSTSLTKRILDSLSQR